MMVLVFEECPTPCPRSTQEQRTNAHATQHAYLASTSGFTSSPLSYFYLLPAPRLITDLMCPMMFILCCNVSRQFHMRLRTDDVISLCDLRLNYLPSLAYKRMKNPNNVNKAVTRV